MPHRRFLTLLVVAAMLLFLTSILLQQRQSHGAATLRTPSNIDPKTLRGDAIMGKLGNETLK